MSEEITRRGRPPRQIEDNTAEQSIAPEAGAPKLQRKRRSAVTGGGLKLHAAERPGFKRRFVNDDKNRIAELQELGYTFAEAPSEATHGPGSRINRLAGTTDDGAPMKTYLMETPIELYEQGRQELDEELKIQDQNISRGLDPSGELEKHARGNNEAQPFYSVAGQSAIKVER